MCTPKRAKIVTICLAVIACILYSFALWTSGIRMEFGQLICKCLEKYYKIVSVLTTVIDSIITLLIPTVLIVWCNTQIVYALTKFYSNHIRIGRRHSGPSNRSFKHKCESTTHVLGTSASNCEPSVNSCIDTSYNRTQMRVNTMLLTVSTVFLITNIPSHAIRWVEVIRTVQNPNHESSHMVLILQKFFQFLYYLNFSVNFILYTVSGRTFRHALCRLCVRMKRSITTYAQTHVTDKVDENVQNPPPMPPLIQLQSVEQDNPKKKTSKNSKSSKSNSYD